MITDVAANMGWGGGANCIYTSLPQAPRLYTTSLSQVIANRNLSHHLYADDTQVYISLSQSNGQEFLST